jgi:hypothetical protein
MITGKDSNPLNEVKLIRLTRQQSERLSAAFMAGSERKFVWDVTGTRQAGAGPGT